MFASLKKAKFFYNYISMHHSQLKIHLTQIQQKIFKTLLVYRQQLELKTILRVAGGWVRDKIMGLESCDIDITLDNMKGQQFVNLIQKHAASKNQKIHGFGVTRFNPQLSKHLETATMKLFDQSIDLVNLRSQKYSQDSRIPIIDIGTPKQDAERRDFTINSLFYNILTCQVQDWTQQGISDIQNGIIRTPLPPLVTFKDDPLRILRCFRFAGRFQFKVVDQIQEAIKNKQVIQALRTKVSKQRVGIQLQGMIKSKNPLLALTYLKNNDLWNVVFEIPKDTDLKDQLLISKIPQYSFCCLERYFQSIKSNKLISWKQLISNPQNKQKNKKKIQYSQQQLQIISRLTCLIVVYRKYRKINPKNTQSLTQFIIKQSLKYSAKYAKFASKCCDSIIYYQKIQDLKNITQIVKWLRISQQKWQIILHILTSITEIETQKRQFLPMELRQLIFNQKLQNTYLVQSHIDGNYLTSHGKKGPIIKIILDNSILWRILNPKSTKQQFIQIYSQNPQFFENQKLYS